MTSATAHGAGDAQADDGAAEVLRVTARIVSALPSLGGRMPAARLIEERPEVLLAALDGSAALRARVRAELGERCAGPALLLVHDDAAVRLAGAGLLRKPAGQAAPGKERRLLERRLATAKAKLETERGRLGYAAADRDAALRELGAVREALGEAEERVERITDALGAERRRQTDPRVAAASLLTLLVSADGGAHDAASRDPRETAPSGSSDLAAACAAAGVSPAAFTRVLDALAAGPAAPQQPPLVSTVDLGLRVTPLGGGAEIGGSCILVEAGGTRILVDVGLRPGNRPSPPGEIEQAFAGPLDAVIVTHAHADHCGYVPAVLARSRRTRVISTAETAKLMPVMWRDSAVMMERRAREDARWGSFADPLFGLPEVHEAAARTEAVPFGRPFEVGRVTVELFPSGHILGAAGVLVRIGDRRVVVTGDISGFGQESVDGHRLPESARGADLLLLETTCCADNHTSREARVADLVRSVEEVWDRGGRALIPAFALGRAQEIALIVRRHLPHVPLLLDGMARDLGHSFEHLTAGGARPLHIFGDRVRPARRPADLTRFRRGAVITTSGMLNGGPAVAWAAEILPDAASALFLSGYQDEESVGRTLLEAVEKGRSFTLPGHDRPLTIRAGVRPLRLSAHADRTGLRDIVDGLAPAHTMLVHGRPGPQRGFAALLAARGHATTPTASWAP